MEKKPTKIAKAKADAEMDGLNYLVQLLVDPEGDLRALDLPPKDPEAAQAGQERAMALPPGVFLRNACSGTPELVVGLRDGLSHLERIFSQPVTGAPVPQNRFRQGLLLLHPDIMSLHYRPINGGGSDGNHVMLLIYASKTAAQRRPNVEFMGETPDDLEIRKSAHGDDYTVLHFSCPDPEGEIIFDCPSADVLRLELSESIFPD